MSAAVVLALAVWVPLTGLHAWLAITGRRLYGKYPKGIREGPFLRGFGLAYLALGTFFCFDIVRYGIEPEAVVATYIFGSIAAFIFVRDSRKASRV